MLNWLKGKKWLVANALLVGVLVSILGIQVIDKNDILDRSVKIGVGNEKVITLGHIAYAAGSVDYTYDGVADDVQFQAALNALPATGGRLVDVSAVQKNFAATVTRAIPNVTITGTGAGSYFVRDGVTPLFTAGGNGWGFYDFRTDAGSINVGATTNWMWTRVTVAATYYAYRSPYGQSVFNDATVVSLTDSGLTSGRIPIAGTGGLLSDSGNLRFDTGTNTLTTITANATTINAPTGRSATFTVASVNATATVKAQSDYVCDGTADDVQINAAIAALPVGGGTVQLTDGTFYLTAPITSAKTALHLKGNGFSGITVLYLVSGSNCNMFGAPDTVARILEISGIEFNGNKAGNASGNGISIDYYNGAFLHDLLIHDCKENGIYSSIFPSGFNGHKIYCISNGVNGIYILGQGNIWTDMFLLSNGDAGIRIQAGGDYNIEALVESNVGYGAVFVDGGDESKIKIWASDNGQGSLLVSTKHSIIELYSRRCGVNRDHVYLYDAAWCTITVNISPNAESAGSNAFGYSFNPINNTIRGIIDVPGFLFYNRGGGGLSLANTLVEASYVQADSGIYGNGNPAAFPTIRGNTGFVTENTGAGTILTGTTSTVVTHGLSVLPVAGQIWVTPTSLMGSASYLFVDTYTSANFTVNSDVDPATANITFAWGKN